jgi:hypothetical protein
VLVARKMYDLAVNRNRGSMFKDALDWCLQTSKYVEDAGGTPIRAIHEAALHIYYRWRVARSLHSEQSSPIDWQFLRDTAARSVQTGQAAQDPLHRFILALSLAHLGQWTDANSIFMQLRQSNIPSEVLWAPRAYYLESKGGAKRIQGVVRRGAGRDFLYVEDLKTDLHLDRRRAWPREGETALAYIQFSFGGATAIEKFT